MNNIPNDYSLYCPIFGLKLAILDQDRSLVVMLFQSERAMEIQCSDFFGIFSAVCIEYEHIGYAFA